MDAKPNRYAQAYGYGVCIIAVITFLICASVVVNNVFDLANPVQATGGLALSSFEAYQADQRPAAVGAARADTSEAAQRKRYEALRADRIAHVTFQAWKAIVTSALLMLISVGLFVFHWRWLKRLGAAEAAGT